MLKKSKKFCSALLTVMILAGSFAACSSEQPETSSGSGDAVSVSVIDGTSALSNPLGDEAENGPINLKVWGPEAAQDILRDQCERFIKNMSDYAEINIEVVPQGEADPAAQLLTDATVGADVFGFACDSLDKLVNAGAIQEIVGKDKEFVISENSEASVNSATVDGKVYAFPETGDNSYCLVYDKTVVSEEQSKTLEGVLKACKEKNKKFVMDARDGYFSCIFLLTGGIAPEGFEDDGETQKFSAYNMKTATKTILAFRDLFSKYKDTFLNAEVTKVVDGFKSGTVGAGIDGSWNFAYTKEALGDNAGFAVLPTINIDGVDTQIVNMFGYKLIGVNSSTQYPNTSCELAKFLTSEECQLERVVQLNWGPSNKKAIENEVVKNDEALSAILAQQEFSVPQVSIAQTFWPPVATLGNNVVDFDTTLDDKKCEELIKQTIANVRDE